MGLKRNTRRSFEALAGSGMVTSNRHSLPEQSSQQVRSSLWDLLLLAAAAVGLTFSFWPTLWAGGGLIGGDTYTYYFPQKVAYQEALRAGRLPLWNSLVSLGYPQLAESQTGALYPPNLILYHYLDVNTAYNASHLLHYVAAYLFTWLLARRFGLQPTGAHLAALSFVYGWFPPRACLEWAIFGGTYFPLIIWCIESYLQSARVRWLGVASVALAAFLTTGHFNLAFITLLLAALLIVLRLTWARSGLADAIAAERRKSATRCSLAIAIGFALAAPQLLPTIELKSVSQREDGSFNQSYGNIPVWYLTQPFWPTLWYAPDINPDQSLFNSNRIEANLYFGVIPFYLALAGIFQGFYRALLQREVVGDRRMAILILAGFAGVVLASGVLMPVLRFVPGFGYFAGPGRYGMLTALAVGIVGGRMFDRLLGAGPFRRFWLAIGAAAFAVTLLDLSYVHNCVTYLTFVQRAPISLRHASPVGLQLRPLNPAARLFAPGPNLPSTIGVNCVPEYLGIGPRQYYDRSMAIPRYSPEEETPALRQSLIDWLQRAGVTHVLTQSPLNEPDWPVSAASVMLDPFLNAAWGMGGKPVHLYRLGGSRARAFLEGRPNGAGVILKEHHPENVTLEVDAPGEEVLVLLDLAYPGWTVRIDGQPAQADTFEGMYRSVRVPAGRHVVEWTYVPRSLNAGVAVSALAAIGLAVWMTLAHRRRHQSASE